MGQLLIVTDASDMHSDAVIRKLDGSELEPVRLNTENFIQRSSYRIAWDCEGHLYENSIKLTDSLRSLEDVKVIWWRKPRSYSPFSEVTDEWARKYCIDETTSLIQSLPGLFPEATWINNYYNLRYPSRRINQIPILHQLGLVIPPTLVTNQYEAIVEFLASHGDCIIKPMDYSGFLYGENQYACYTRPIDVEAVKLLKDSIHLAPVFIQQRVEKKAEYRVTLIGDKSFVCRIESKHLKDAEVEQDWRATDPDKLIHVQDSLPEEYITKLHQMLKTFGLHFGAFDIIRGDDDALYFIELNPNGQWLWIETLTGMPMVEAMVKLIHDLAAN